MKLLIKPIYGKPFIVEGTGKYENGCYYINGQSFPKEIVENIGGDFNFVGLCAECGKVVNQDKAFDYALERILNGTLEEKMDFVEWFYSGNWVKERIEGEL